MADETEDTTATDTLDQQDDAAEDSQPLELPEDPEQLKEFAKTAISEKLQLQRERAQLQADRDRLKELEEEQRTKATYWATDAEAKAAELRQLRGKATAKAAKETSEPSDDDEELAVLAANGM